MVRLPVETSEVASSELRATYTRLKQAKLALQLAVLVSVLMTYLIWSRDASVRQVAIWSLFNCGGLALAYVAIRKGWTRRFADPSLTAAQMAYAMLLCAAGYCIAGKLRGAAFPIVMVIMAFSMFQLRGRAAWWMTGFTLLVFGTAMALMSALRPTVYLPLVELGHFIMLSCMLPAMALLSGRINRINQRLSHQRAELAQALAKIEDLARLDHLTGLLNRRQMQSLLEQECLRHARHPRSFCIALLDLDHFKRINDEHGHAAGDHVLQRFARAASEAIRSADLLGRWGGEEFVLLLPDTTLQMAHMGLRRVRDSVAALVLSFESKPLRVTFSAGLVEYRESEGLVAAINRADALLYEAKRQGRERILSGQ